MSRKFQRQSYLDTALDLKAQFRETESTLDELIAGLRAGKLPPQRSVHERRRLVSAELAGRAGA